MDATYPFSGYYTFTLNLAGPARNRQDLPYAISQRSCLGEGRQWTYVFDESHQYNALFWRRAIREVIFRCCQHNRGDDSEDRPQRSSFRRSRERDDVSRDISHRSSGSRRSRDRDDFSEDRPQRLSGTRRARDQEDDDESRSHRSSRPRRSRDPDESRGDRTGRSGRSSQPTSSSSSSTTPAWQTRPG